MGNVQITPVNVFTAEWEVWNKNGMTPTCYSTSLHTGSRGETVSNWRGEEGLFGRGGGVEAGVDWRGEARNVTLHKHSNSCTVYKGVAAKKKWDNADSIKEQEQVTESKHHSWAIIDLAPGSGSFITCVKVASEMRAMSSEGMLLQGINKEKSSTGHKWGKQVTPYWVLKLISLWHSLN